MIKFNKNQALQIITITSFLLLTIAIIIAWLNPATSYEVSIYASTPLFFWIALIFGYIVSFVLILCAACNFCLPPCLAYSKYILLGLCTVALTSLFIIRGHFVYDISSDVGSHVATLNNILSSGFTDVLYPSGFIETASLHLMTGVDQYYLMNINSLLYLLIFIFGIYLFIKEICEKKGERYLSLFITCMFIFGSSVYMTGRLYFSMYIPYLMSFMLFPLFAYILYRYLRSVTQNKSIFYISIILLFAMLNTHILIFLAAILLIIAVVIQEIIKSYRCSHSYTSTDKANSIKNTIYFLKNNSKIISLFSLTIISTILFLVRAIDSGRYISLTYTLKSILIDDVDSSKYASLTNQAADFVISNNIYTTYEIFEIIFSQIGLLIIICISYLLIIPFLYRQIKEKHCYINMISLFTFLISVAVLWTIPLIMNAGYGSWRFTLFVTLIGIPILGILLYNYLEHFFNNITKIRYLYIIMFILIICSVSVLGIISYYPSPYSATTSHQTTYSTLDGADFYISNINSDYEQIGSYFRPYRYALALYGDAAYAPHGYSVEWKDLVTLPHPPDHFNYNINNTLRGTYDKLTYLYTSTMTVGSNPTSATKYTKNIRWTDTDLIHLNYDPTVDKIYNNSEIILYLIYL